MSYAQIPGKSKFFNTGFLNTNTLDNLRKEQKLLPQTIANNCAYTENSTQNVFSLYTMTQTPLPTYGKKPISSKCPCVQYVNPP